jgi:PAS domain S-box-containing protein
MSVLMRAHDWTATPLGPPEAWPDGLKVPLRMMLTSRFEMWLGWGENLAVFYNDAYIPTLGAKHPDALGQPMRRVWSEVFADVEDRVVSVMRDGIPTWDKALMLFLERNGYLEETYHTFSYSPLIGASGAIEGLMCVVTEETERVISERRLESLRILATLLLSVRERQDIIEAARAALGSNLKDFPFGLIRFFGADPGSSAGSALELTLESVPWPFDALREGEASVISLLGDLIQDPPKGVWEAPPNAALTVAIRPPGASGPTGALVVGLNPYRPHDPSIVGFAQLIAAQIAGAQATVDARASEAAEMERWRRLFEQSPSFIAILRGPDHRFELVNPRYLELVGHRDIIGLTVHDAIPEVREQGFIQLLDRVYATGEAFVGQSSPILIQRTPTADLEERFLDFVYQPIRNDAGAVTGIFVEGIDVTNAHDAVAALRESEAKFRILAEAMPNQVWTSTPDGKLDWFNGQLIAYSDMTSELLAGDGWTAIVYPEDVDAAKDRWRAALASGKIYEAEFRLRRADGVYRWHLTRGVALRNDAGVITRWIGANTDIQEQKTTAEALSSLNANLERQVQERTSQLMAAEDALRQSQKMEALGQLTGGVAHDFNNLLQVVSGNLHLLAGDLEGNALAGRRITNALAGLDRGAKLASQLLAFGRRQPLEPKVVNVGRFVSGLDDMLRHALGEAVEIETIVSGGLWNTFVDPTQIENAVLNLAINARDAMDGSGRLTIEVGNAFLDDIYARGHPEVSPGQYVLLAVTDTGKGMSPEIVSQVFEPFFSTKPVGKGTGLGLSMVYGFVKQSGGHIKIYSEVGHGTTVKLYLPRVDLPEDRLTVVDSGPVVGGTETILVAEDDEEVRATVVEMLGALGYRVLTAKDAANALAVIESGVPIDLLLTDVVMPGPLRSPELARLARERLPDLAVLFTSGFTDNAIVHGGRLDPGVELLTKPYGRETLARKVRQVLANQAQRGGRSDALNPIPTVKPASLKVLLVEDDVLIRLVTAEMLTDLGHEVVEAGSAEQATEALAAETFDVLVSDLNLPGVSGAAFAGEARRVQPQIGVVFATGVDQAPAAPDVGAAPYLLRKPYDIDALAESLAAVSGTRRGA